MPWMPKVRVRRLTKYDFIVGREGWSIRFELGGVLVEIGVARQVRH